MTQKNLFLESEGDAWFTRNRADDAKLRDKITHDPILNILKSMNLAPKSVLEIGCSDGWRLAALQTIWPEAKFKGIDPSRRAAAHSTPGILIEEGTADDLPYRESEFDLVIFGFCLYLCDRQDLFKIASEADRVLKDGGRMVTYDFHAPEPYRNKYIHHEGVFSYKMDYSRMFAWNPAYKTERAKVETHPGMDAANPDNDIGVFVMRKDLKNGWLERA